MRLSASGVSVKPNLYMVGVMVAVIGIVPFSSIAQSSSCNAITCPDGRRIPCPSSHPTVQETLAACGVGGSRGTSGASSSYDYEAARRAQEAEAAREQQRQADERAARELKEREDAAQKAKFLADRNAAAKTLKGLPGTSPVFGGTGASNPMGLKGTGTDLGIKGLAADQTARDLSGHHAAWKQIHCAANISGYAFAAIQDKGDYQEFKYLAAEAAKALEGGSVGVECGTPPPFPEASKSPVDTDKIKERERQVLNRAVVLAERMNQQPGNTLEKPNGGTNPPAAETPDDKMRRLQRELNRINSAKVTGKTQAEIDKQEKDRKEMAQLAIQMTSITVDASISSKPPRTRRTPPLPGASSADPSTTTAPGSASVKGN